MDITLGDRGMYEKRRITGQEAQIETLDLFVCDVSIYLGVSPCTAAVSHSQPAAAGISHDSCRVQAHH